MRTSEFRELGRGCLLMAPVYVCTVVKRAVRVASAEDSCLITIGLATADVRRPPRAKDLSKENFILATTKLSCWYLCREK